MEAVVKACKENGIPIRIGVNAGSLEKHLLEKYGYPTPEAMVESALYHIGILEELDFHDIIVSLKASDVPMAIAAYTKAAEVIPLSASSGHHGSRHAVFRHDQERGGLRRAAARWASATRCASA